MSYRLGVDVGGTFTDVALLDEATGGVVNHKVPSVPRDPAAGIVHGIRQILDTHDVSPAAVHHVAHGTTVSTNALLERRGPRTGLITTRGFRDLLEIARQKRPSLYDLRADKPPPLVPRELRITIRVLDHECSFLGTMDRCTIQPWGLAGGEPGRGGRTVLHPGMADERLLPSKVWGYVLGPGDVVSMETPGGGGDGPPETRRARDEPLGD